MKGLHALLNDLTSFQMRYNSLGKTCELRRMISVVPRDFRPHSAWRYSYVLPAFLALGKELGVIRHDLDIEEILANKKGE